MVQEIEIEKEKNSEITTKQTQKDLVKNLNLSTVTERSISGKLNNRLCTNIYL